MMRWAVSPLRGSAGIYTTIPRADARGYYLSPLRGYGGAVQSKSETLFRIAAWRRAAARQYPLAIILARLVRSPKLGRCHFRAVVKRPHEPAQIRASFQTGDITVLNDVQVYRVAKRNNHQETPGEGHAISRIVDLPESPSEWAFVSRRVTFPTTRPTA